MQDGDGAQEERLAEAEMRKTSERAFHAYGTRIEVVTEFGYLGKVLTATDDDWPAVAGNIQKARVSWGSLTRVLGREGADPKVSRSFYTAVTQQVLHFGTELWVLTEKNGICPGRLPGQGSTAADRTAAPPGEGREMVLPLPGGGSKAGGGCEGQEIGPLEIE